MSDISGYQRLKLHVLNAAHSALAYLGLPRGHVYVRQAIADPQLLRFLDEMVAAEIAPALAPLDVASYWHTVKARLANPMIDHRLAQIAEDGSLKLPQRLFPLLEVNAAAGRQISRMADVVRAWLDLMATRPPRDPPMPGWPNGPRPAPIKRWRWTIRRCFRPSSAATHGCAPRSSNASAAHRGAPISLR